MAFSARQQVSSSILLVVLFQVSEGALKFTVEPPSPSYAENGSNAKLVWDYSDDNPGSLLGIVYSVRKSSSAFTNMLLKGVDGSVTPFPSLPAAYKGRVRIEGRATFVLENVTPQDSTLFQCQLKGQAGGDKSSIVNLIVTVAPEISITTPPPSYNEGSVVSINCTASGIPEPDVKWFRNEKIIIEGKKTALLMFNNVSKTDDGQYKCQANNSVGDTENYVALVVHYKPEGTTLTISAADNTVTQGDTVTFTCDVTAARPKVSQYIFSLNGTTIVKVGNGSQYTINNVQRSQHYGKYKCVPSNNVGDGPEATATLNVNVPMQFTTLPKNLTVNETNSILLSCDASGFPEPSFTWTKNGKVLSESKQLNIQRSYRNNTGMYKCTASNGVGQDTTAQSFVTVQYPPTIKTVTVSSDKSWIGQTVTLTCRSDGFPLPTLTWYKPNGSQINSDTAKESTVDVKMSFDQDFGIYKCIAGNGLTPDDLKAVEINQIKAPGSPTIVQLDIQATSLTVKWTAPGDDGGSPITAYRVVLLKDGTEIKNENITDPGKTSLSAGDLRRITNYTVKVFARNAVFEGPAVEMAVKTKYEGVPAAATIDNLPNEVADNTVSLKWSEPQNNGKEITQYTVYQRVVADDKPGEWVKLKTIRNSSVREFTVDLTKGKVYEFVVTATNGFGESLKEPEKFVRVMASGVPAAVELNDIPSEVADNTITLKWNAPENYGSKIKQYTVYERMVIDGKPGEWIRLKTITDVSVRELTVELEKGKKFEFVVTATNVHGESKIEDKNVKRVMAKGEPGGDDHSQQSDEGNGMGAAIYAGAAAAGVLLIIGIIVIIVLWRRRKPSSDEDTSRDELGSANPYESEDGYHSASREAAQSLQASVPAAEPDYALVDQSRKKKNRMPANDEYAQVDKSKKTKKKKKPGELDYADLEDLRADVQLGPVPSGGAAAAAPIVRPPAYEGTEYADISQFGVPRPDPTYANVPKQEVVYSNVESM